MSMGNLVGIDSIQAKLSSNASARQDLALTLGIENKWVSGAGNRGITVNAAGGNAAQVASPSSAPSAPWWQTLAWIGLTGAALWMLYRLVSR